MFSPCEGWLEVPVVPSMPWVSLPGQRETLQHSTVSWRTSENTRVVATVRVRSACCTWAAAGNWPTRSSSRTRMRSLSRAAAESLRSAGRFLSALRSKVAMGWVEMAGGSCTSCGLSWRCTISATEAPCTAGVPVRHSRNISPQAYRSVRALGGSPRSCSGAL